MRSCFIIACALIFWGCGSDEVPVERNNANSNPGTDAGDGDTGDENAMAIRVIYTGVCEKAFECCSTTQARTVAGVAEVEECAEGALQPYSPLTAGALADALGRSSVEVNPGQVDLCRQAVADLSCEQWNTTNPFDSITACSDFVSPRLNENDPCSFDFECRSELCVDTGNRGQVCATRVAIEATCDPAGGVLCEQGASCDTFGGSRCVALLENGSSCVSESECTSGVCDVGPQGTNECRAQPPICEAPS